MKYILFVMKNNYDDMKLHMSRIVCGVAIVHEGSYRLGVAIR